MAAKVASLTHNFIKVVVTNSPFHQTLLSSLASQPQHSNLPVSSMATASVDTVVGMFSHANILQTHALGMEPSYDSIHATVSQLNAANAASVPS
jgi:hypothetical protein